MKLNFFSKAILAKIFLYSGFFLPLLANAQNLANAQKSVDEMCLCNRGPSKKIEGRDFEVAVMTYKRGNIAHILGSFQSQGRNGPSRLVPDTMNRCRIALKCCTGTAQPSRDISDSELKKVKDCVELEAGRMGAG